jgi:proline iminopeptidase
MKICIHSLLLPVKARGGSIAAMEADADPLYPFIEPHAQGWLPEHEGHRIYWEECGNPAGLAVVFLHGGPGSGASPAHPRFFDPAGYRIVLLDQRGCGRSTPRGELGHNTTELLVADIERLRAHLGIARWLVVGGSWGAALALAYAARHKAACLGLILRGTFLTGRADLDWFFAGAGALLPEAYQQFLAPVPKSHRRNLLAWFERTLKGSDRDAALLAVRHWMAWETALARPGQAPAALPEIDAEAAPALLDKYRLQAHYLQRQCFLGERRLLDCAARLHGLPTLLLHGRLDLVCRPANAWRLHQTLHGSRLTWVEGAGHNPFDPPMAEALLGATQYFLQHSDFADLPPITQ